METGWAYVGIDLSPAPLKTSPSAAAIRKSHPQPLARPVTLNRRGHHHCAVKAVHVKQTGYNGLMLPILEDSRLAERWSQAASPSKACSRNSAVCGTGLDTIPLPATSPTAQLSLILATSPRSPSNGKSLSPPRLLPVKEKSPATPPSSTTRSSSTP